MKLEKIILHHWHIPTSTLSFLKLLIKNRNIEVENHIDAWKSEILSIKSLSEQELTLLEKIIKRIDSTQSEYTIEVLFSLIKDTAIRYYEGRYVLMKYLQSVTYEDVWNNWYYQTRGCVIDLEEMKLVSASMPKFFNINEKPHTSFANVVRKSNNGKVTKYVKQDGSCITMSFEDIWMVTTPGSFESKQVLWAKEYLEKKHKLFLNHVKEKMPHLTFIFEYVGPENRVVVFYKESDMVLLQVIDTRTGYIYTYEEMLRIANQFGFTPCSIVEDDIETLMIEKDNAEKYKADSIEGWVIRIDSSNETFLVKLKCTDYVQMHHMISNVLNPKWVYESMLDETLDDNIAMIENDEVKKIVVRMKEKIKEWEKSVKLELETIYHSIPSHLWIEDSTLENHREFEKAIEQKIRGNLKEDRIKSHLQSFAKGKMENPKEEIRAKAIKLYQMSPIDESKLEEYDAYKMFISKRIEEILKEMKEAFNQFVFEGHKHEIYGEWLEETYPHYFNLSNMSEDTKEWEEMFKRDKNEFYRLAQISKEKLTPAYYSIHEYAKLKYQFMTEIQQLIPGFKKQVTDYIFKERTEIEGILEKVILKEWIINEELHSFYQEKKNFEMHVVPELFPNEEAKNINSIIKEFYLLLRGQEVDQSYEMAKGIFNDLSEYIKDQSEYFSKRGQFSGFANKQIKGPYRNFVFDLLDCKRYEKEQYIREIQMLKYANIVVDESKEDIKRFDIDFRDIKEWTNQIELEE